MSARERLYAEAIPDGTFGGARTVPEVTPEQIAERRAVLAEAGPRRTRTTRHLHPVPTPPPAEPRSAA